MIYYKDELNIHRVNVDNLMWPLQFLLDVLRIIHPIRNHLN